MTSTSSGVRALSLCSSVLVRYVGGGGDLRSILAIPGYPFVPLRDGLDHLDLSFDRLEQRLGRIGHLSSAMTILGALDLPSLRTSLHNPAFR